VDGTGPGSHAMAGSGISSVETLGSTTRDLVSQSVSQSLRS
jgi:hypothetical protein